MGLECSFGVELMVIIGGFDVLGQAKGIPRLLMPGLINWMGGGTFHWGHAVCLVGEGVACGCWEISNFVLDALN